MTTPYVALELGSLDLALRAPLPADSSLRIDLQLIGTDGIFAWSSTGSSLGSINFSNLPEPTTKQVPISSLDVKYGTSSTIPESIHENDEEIEIFIYRLQLTPKIWSTLPIQCQSSVITSLASTYIGFSILRINPIVPAGTKPSKNAPISSPPEEILSNFILPIANLILSKTSSLSIHSNCIEFPFYTNDITSKSFHLPSLSSTTTMRTEMKRSDDDSSHTLFYNSNEIQWIQPFWNSIHSDFCSIFSLFDIKMIATTSLASYFNSGRLIWWESISFSNVPVQWRIQVPTDELTATQPLVNTTNKKKSTENVPLMSSKDRRNAFWKLIKKKLEQQDEIASYRCEIGVSNDGKGTQDSDGEDGNEFGTETDGQLAGKSISSTEDSTNWDETMRATHRVDALRRLLPAVSLPTGKVSCDVVNSEATAASMTATLPDSDVEGIAVATLQAATSEWYITWPASSAVFLSEKQLKKLRSVITAEPSHAFLPLTLRKVPTSGAMLSEGGEMFATTLVNLAAIISPGASGCETLCELRGDGMSTAPLSETAVAAANVLLTPPQLRLRLCCSEPIVPAPVKLGKLSLPTPTSRSKSTIKTVAQPSRIEAARDVLGELRVETHNAITRILQEYIALYPVQQGSESSSSSGNTQSFTEERRRALIEFLATHGVWHDLQERMRVTVENLIHHLFSLRGRALGRSSILAAHDTGECPLDLNSSAVRKLLLSEIYTLVMRDAHSVLGAMFPTTLIQKSPADAISSAQGSDEFETPVQRLARHLQIACDAASRGHYAYGLERFLDVLGLVDTSLVLGPMPTATFATQKCYAVFLLHWRAAIIATGAGGSVLAINRQNRMSSATMLGDGYSLGSEESLTSTVLLLHKARDVLSCLIDTKQGVDDWETGVLLVAALMEDCQEELAEEVLLTLINSDLRRAAMVDGDDEMEETSEAVEWKAASASAFAGSDAQSFNSSRTGVGAANPLDNGKVEEDIVVMDSFAELSGYASDDLCPVNPLFYALLACVLKQKDQPLNCRKALFLTARCAVETSFEGITDWGHPRRPTTAVLSRIALISHTHGLYNAAAIASQLANECESAAIAKSIRHGTEDRCPAPIAFLHTAINVSTAWGPLPSSSSLQDAIARIPQCVITEGTPAQILESKFFTFKAWNILAIRQQVSSSSSPMDTGAENTSSPRRTTRRLHSSSNTSLSHDSPSDLAIQSFKSTIQYAMQDFSPCDLAATNLLPLETIISGCTLLLSANHYEDALFTLQFGLRIFYSSALLTLVGVAYLRLDRLELAEAAFKEAIIADSQHPDAWAYLSVTILTRSGSERTQEASVCLRNSLKCNLMDSALLREVATAWLAVDELSTAEDLIRRALSSEMMVAMATGGVVRSGGRTRKLLADVLAGQNHAAAAVQEYKLVLNDVTSSDDATRAAALSKCISLLTSLDRKAEATQLRKEYPQFAV